MALDKLKEILGEELYKQFNEKIKDNKDIKLADLSDGEYISKKKFDSKETEIAELNERLKTRDTDLETIQTSLNEAETKLKAVDGNEVSVKELQDSIKELQTKYDTDTENYATKLKDQSYEFAIKEATSGLKFSSNLAKEAFTDKLMKERLQLNEGKILGFDDYVNQKKEADPTAFIEDKEPETPTPKFASGSGSNIEPTPKENPFGFDFNPIRAENK